MTKIADVMTKDPITLERTATVYEAAKKMRDADVGPVIVLDGQRICGIVTDRDITIRTVAEGKDPSIVKLQEICTDSGLQTVAPDDDVDEAVRLMRDKAIRRLPVVQDGKAVGIVSLGDLSQEEDVNAALSKISSSPPNN